ncbi:MAG TPA: GYD domain-containing protein [Acidimicrobiales bacterium]|nr:GYD domain-containing protein [Acidimicrobiales bacterium]
MATYIMLIKLSEEAAANVQDAKRGRTAGKKAASALGLEWKRSYLLMGGEYDVLIVLEAPDEETMARFSLLGAMSGAVRTRTMRAFTEGEADQLLGSLAEVTELVA